MPYNKFPESPEKQELRRRDARRIADFQNELGRKLDYCGMPSVEFLDVDVWEPYLRSVTAIELSFDMAEDMRIERDKKPYSFPVKIFENDIYSFLSTSKRSYDLYNIDPYGGLLYPTKTHKSRSIEAIRSVFRNQSSDRRSFILINTFNVRGRGALEYLDFLDRAKEELKGKTNSRQNINGHVESQATRLKICFPFFCWLQ